MAEAPDSPVRDKNYNLIWALEASLHNVWKLETYIQDAEREGDGELAEWFRKIQHNNQKAGEQGKKMLAERLARE
ncbi:hypothetical protein M4I32_09805 [Microbacterium sp. LRZ72]|uniref:hypothetical protein n=1 Tax=Microbacterium sp. LRZ72 TaxID=2942481 RepID=UPI0029B876DB|nr:hypothetical protein [Microbacterium sp. LRZ72]MDX2377092.1 hypothetical protein [Microbacterium sp. LRZ72]